MCSQECVLPVPDEIVGGLIDEMYRYEQTFIMFMYFSNSPLILWKPVDDCLRYLIVHGIHELFQNWLLITFKHDN